MTRQREVLRLLAKGKSNREVAEYLSISLGIVKQHITGAIEALEESDRNEARDASQADSI
jgi:DNA-binding NarL/FixJ family response regulator